MDAGSGCTNRTVLPLVGYIPFAGSFSKGLGIFQPLADGLKFLFKEEMIPGHVNKFYYNLAPIVALVPALTTMTVLPFGEFFTEDGEVIPLMLANLEVGILFVLAVSSLGVYGIVLAGWSSNSKYPFPWRDSFFRSNDILRACDGLIFASYFSMGQ